MQGLKTPIGEMASALDAMLGEELRRLEETVQQLTPEQVDFVRRTLKAAR